MLLDGTDRFWHESVAEIGSDRPVTGRSNSGLIFALSGSRSTLKMIAKRPQASIENKTACFWMSLTWCVDKSWGYNYVLTLSPSVPEIANDSRLRGIYNAIADNNGTPLPGNDAYHFRLRVSFSSRAKLPWTGEFYLHLYF